MTLGVDRPPVTTYSTHSVATTAPSSGTSLSISRTRPTTTPPSSSRAPLQSSA
ncbi:hypothetical protein [Gemmatimonas aurantiaca]|uniref:hypothetical protein n=1 Tax=Gemmatimonas aurantiaca TaxID=173480 RepID=UPI00301D7433